MIKVNNTITRLLKINNIEYILLTLILITGFFLRVYKIDNPIADWHSWRQADTASVTRNFSEKGINFLRPTYHDISTIQTGIFNPEGLRLVEFPLYNALNSLLYDYLNVFTLENWARLTSIFSALITTVFLYLLGKRFISVAGGLLSSFFYLVIPYNIYFTRVILPEPFGVMLATAAVWFFVRFYDDSKLYFLYISSFLFGLSLLVKPYLIFFVVPVLYLAHQKNNFFRIYESKSVVFKYVIFGIISLFPLLLWRYWIGNHPEGIPFYKWVFNGDGIRFKPSFWKWIFSERLGSLILGVWGIVPFTFGILRNQKLKFVNSFLIGMFLYVSIVATANVKHDYYQTLIVPSVSLALASGSYFMWRGIKKMNKIATRSVLILSFVVMFMTGLNKIRDFYKIDHPEIIAAGVAADKLLPKDALVIAPYNGDTAFLYQTKRWGWPYRDRSLDELIEKGADYFVSVNFDAKTAEAMERFEIVEKTDSYVIIDLNKPVAE